VVRGAELRAVRAALDRARVRMLVYAMDVGPRAGEVAAAKAIGEAAQARRALVTGLCGALDGDLPVGSVLLFDTLDDGAGATLRTGGPLEAAAAIRLPGARRGVRAVSSPRIVTSAREKRALADRSRASAVDMESFSVLRTLQAAGWDSLVLRVVSDGLDDDLPDLNAALGSRGELNPARLAFESLRRPAAGLKLAINGVTALKRLESALARLFSRR
jgi:nucleoside phosphorylase